MVSLTIALSLLFAAGLPAQAAVAASTPVDDPVARLRAYENARKEIIARLAPAVCSVMSLSRPGGGSGVIFHPRGWILTNYHVTGKNKVMKIGLPDGKFHLADVIGVDPGGDIAVCALRGQGPLEEGRWPAVVMGDSDRLRIGGLAYAMGNPFLLASDFKPTVTIGIVSGIHRYQAGSGPNGRMLSYPDCIQVDTPINPGNSGGPLFDENGLLVGINGRISVRDRGRVNTGVGFAVSINQIKNFLPGLLAGWHCEHGTLDMNIWRMEDPNTGVGEGIFVQGILADSVTVKSGLQLGDMVTSFNGHKLEWANQLAREVGMLPAGFEVTVGYRRYVESTRSYEQEREVQLHLAAIDTGSKADRTPNVPDLSERPDFEVLRREAAENAKKEAEAAKRAAVEGPPEFWPDKDGVPEGLRKALPPDWEKGKLPDEWWKGLPADQQKKFRAELEKAGRIKKSPKRDIDREEHVFRFMDGVMEEFRTRFAGTLDGVARSDRTLVADAVFYENGKETGKGTITWRTAGDDLELTDRAGTWLLSKATEGSDLHTTLQRERATNPLLDPHGLVESLRDAWLDGGVFIGNHVGYVCVPRDEAKRAVYLDRDGLFPLGYRYRSFQDGGLRETRFVEFAERDGIRVPTRAEVRINGDLREVLTYREAADRVGFKVPAEGDLPRPSGEVEARLQPLLRSVVKIYGASGLRGIPSYGSGIVVSPQGHVLTWTHVSLLQGRCRVVLEDGSVHEYVRHREYPELGITILRPENTLAKTAPIRPMALPADPVSYPPGTPVFSVGNPFKLAEFAELPSITFGVIVSTVRSDLRLNLRQFPFQGDVLIVDAPSNPGTQGGGLFTVDGAFVGLLVPLVESAETNTQLAIAVPAHELAAAVAQAIGDKAAAADIVARRTEEERRPVYTGIKLFDTGRQRSPPAYVDRVYPRSPAWQKLRSDDLIVRINEFPIRTCAEFRRVLRQFGPGDEVDITFKRGSTVDKVTVKLEEEK